jgi:hypothetical protein
MTDFLCARQGLCGKQTIVWRKRRMKLNRFAVVLLAVLAVTAPAQAQNWWSSADGNTESGKIEELKQKRKAFLNVSFTSQEPDINVQQEQAQIRRLVSRALSAYPGLELVTTPDLADIAINISASQSATAGATGNFSANLDPELQTPLEVTVLVRGRMQRDGTYRSRIVWQMSSQNVHGEPAPAAVFAIDGFLDQLKRVRGEKK